MADAISTAHEDVEKATEALDKLNADFRSEGRQALEEGEHDTYGELVEEYMQEETKLRREVELAYGRLGDAQRGIVRDDEEPEEAAVEEEQGDERTLEELHERATELDIEGRSDMDKEQLGEAVRAEEARLA